MLYILNIVCDYICFVVDLVTVGFDPDSYSVTEGGVAMLRLVLSAPSQNEATVDLVTVDQSAVGKHLIHHT